MGTHAAGSSHGRHAMDSEARRLRALAEHLWSITGTLQRLPIDDWRGAARDRFDDLRGRLDARLRAIAGRCEDAATVLDRHHATVSALHRAGAPAVDERLATQAAQAADDAGRELAALAHELDALHRLVGEDAQAPCGVRTAPEAGSVGSGAPADGIGYVAPPPEVSAVAGRTAPQQKHDLFVRELAAALLRGRITHMGPTV